ncbi:hypothetical protein [Nocardia callitridis]|uniref:DUF8176 domain-containing protein n=1 Tax=Nocardia callitridis TaxID=648753 RepID=A0ABP9KVU9_9NOCA
MTNSDRDKPNQEPAQDNPFDTGLPMLRTPSGKTSKRRRRPGGRRKPVRREPEVRQPENEPVAYHAEPTGPTPPQDGLTDKAFDVDEQRSGSWEQWLDQEQSAATSDTTDYLTDETGYAAGLSDRPAHEEAQGYEDYQEHAPTIVNRSGLQPGTPLRHPRRNTDQRRSNRPLGILIGVGIVVAAAAITLALANVINGDTGTAATPAPTNARLPDTAGLASPSGKPAPQATNIATADCRQQRTAQVVSGTDPGGTANGADAILAFEYAYYVQRSGYRARDVVAEDASVSPAEQIQRGINQLPIDTRYCVRITRAGVSQDDWEVQLTQQLPGDEPETFTQIVTTRTTADRTLITAITGA